MENKKNEMVVSEEDMKELREEFKAVAEGVIRPFKPWAAKYWTYLLENRL